MRGDSASAVWPDATLTLVASSWNPVVVQTAESGAVHINCTEPETHAKVVSPPGLRVTAQRMIQVCNKIS